MKDTLFLLIDSLQFIVWCQAQSLERSIARHMINQNFAQHPKPEPVSALLGYFLLSPPFEHHPAVCSLLTQLSKISNALKVQTKFKYCQHFFHFKTHHQTSEPFLNLQGILPRVFTGHKAGRIPLKMGRRFYVGNGYDMNVGIFQQHLVIFYQVTTREEEFFLAVILYFHRVSGNAKNVAVSFHVALKDQRSRRGTVQALVFLTGSVCFIIKQFQTSSLTANLAFFILHTNASVNFICILSSATP